MHKYFIKTPWLVKKLFPGYVWHLPDEEPVVYLSFDDGPHPEITPWVLEQLNRYHAKASFFCIGKNVVAHPGIYKRIIDEGHAVGNHTFHHLNGWKTADETYLHDVSMAAEVIRSNLFRPPYGRIKSSQAKMLAGTMGTGDFKIIMWDVLSGDFDRSISPERCMDLVMKNTGPGSIVVFHDSEKAFPNLETVLPAVLECLSAAGYEMKKIGLAENTGFPK